VLGVDLRCSCRFALAAGTTFHNAEMLIAFLRFMKLQVLSAAEGIGFVLLDNLAV
jgi:hypothetical protein